jgi:hypothetical protein
MKEFKELPVAMQNNINNLAASMGVTAINAYSLITLTINGMEQDKVVDCIPAMNKEEKEYICETYMCCAVERFTKFSENFQTRATMREGFAALVYNKISTGGAG